MDLVFQVIDRDAMDLVFKVINTSLLLVLGWMAMDAKRDRDRKRSLARKAKLGRNGGLHMRIACIRGDAQLESSTTIGDTHTKIVLEDVSASIPHLTAHLGRER